MVLTYRDIVDEAYIALRHELDARIGEARFVNRVGRRWVGMHAWSYLDGRTATIELSSGVQVYALPRDLSEIRSITEPGVYAPRVHLIDWPEFRVRDERNYGGSYFRYIGAINFEQQDGEMVPMLHLTPDPQGGETLAVGYRAGWRPLKLEADVADVPTWAEEAFLELARAVAHGLSRPSSDGNPDPTGALVRQVKLGDAFQDARTQDGMIQPVIDRGCGALEASLRMQSRDRLVGPRSTTQDLLADL